MYGKIFERMFTGTMYGSGPVVFAVWAYVIATSRPPGVAELNPKLLAATIGCSTEEIRDAIEFLMRPDPDSANTDEEGRRLVHIRGLEYHVVSWQKYRDMRDEEARRDYMREYMRKRRANESQRDITEANKVNRKHSKHRKQESEQLTGNGETSAGNATQDVSDAGSETFTRPEENQCDAGSSSLRKQLLAKLAKAEAEAVKRERSTLSRKSDARASRLRLDLLPEDWKSFCRTERPDLDPETTWQRFRDYWLAKAGAHARKVDWLATWRNWVRNERAPPPGQAKPQDGKREKPDWMVGVV